MATFDQLPAEQRAIIELVVQRGRSYQSLADVLEIAPDRVRQLAREALAELSPVTADRVDSHWRGQVADYLLGQQSGPEASATRGHLKNSEPARTWALSLLDSLDALYGNGARPQIPSGDGSATPPRRMRDQRGRDDQAPAVAPAAGEHQRGAVDETAEPQPERRLSPAASDALRRRRLVSALGGIVALAAIVAGVLALTGSFDSKSKKPAAGRTPPARIVGTIALNPVGAANAGLQGVAVIAERGGQRQIVVQAKLKTTPQNYAYEVWLYNSPTDVYPLGAQQTNQQGIFSGAGPLPANFARFKSVDVSLEKIARSTAHSGPSVLRGDFATIKAPPAQGPSSSSSSTPGK
ncbi:MAG: hypothetical protein NVSMB25_07060 [Thermoleophilaceae bacterium]